jgi:hypothetical protein
MSQEEHAMDKPKKLEVQTDGDLTEIKKDPVWKTFLEKKQYRIESGKRVKLGDLKDYKLPKGQAGTKHKEVKEQTKIRWRKPLKKRGEDMGDKVQHPTDDKDWKNRLKPETLAYLRETPSGVNPKRPDVNVQERDIDEKTGKPKVEHPQTGTPGMSPVREGDKPLRTTSSGLYGPMGASETYVHPKTGKVGAPIQRAMIQLVKFRLRRKKPEVHSGKPAGIPESPGNIDDRKVPKPTDETKRKITQTPFEQPKQINIAHEGGAEPKPTKQSTKKPTARREAPDADPAMGVLSSNRTSRRTSTSPIENINMSYLVWKRDLDETGESDFNQQKGVKVQAHTPEGEEEYESTDPDTGIKTWKTRKIVRPADKPHKVVDPLHPYTELSGGFVQGEKQYNLIDSEQNTLGQTPGKHDKEVKPSNTSPIKSPEVADPEKETLPRPDSLDKPKPGDYGHKRGPQETRGNVHGFFKKMMNITKPIPDSKGGKGSFQHCINANQDKHNPGGWCKQIERKVEGKSKAKKDTWNCSLCNIELPDDELSEKRKKRHADFHKDESIQTGGRQRNWTFGDAEFTLGKQKAWKSWLGKTLQRDMEEKEPLGSKETDREILSGMKRPYKTRPGGAQATERKEGEPGKLRRAIHHPKIGHKDKLREIWEEKHPTHLLGGEYGTKRTGGKPKKEIERKEFMQGKEHGDHPFGYYSERNEKIHAGIDALKAWEVWLVKVGEPPAFFKEEDKKRGRKPDTADKDKEIKEIQRKIDVLSHPYTDDDPERFPGGQRKKPKYSNRLTGTPAKQDTELGPDKSGRGVQISDDERKRRMAVRLESRARTGKPYKQTFEKTPDTKPGAAYSLTPGGDAQRREPPEVRKKKRRAKQTWRDSRKTDYFVEEIRANIIYENKIAPLIGMLAGGVARAVGGIGKKVVQAGVEMAKPQQGEEEE